MIPILPLIKKFIPLKALIMASVVVGVGLCGYFYGKQSQRIEYEESLRIAVQEALEAERIFNDQRVASLEEFYADKLKNNVRTIKEVQEVIKYVESDAGARECLDDTGVQLANRIIAKELSTPSE